MWFSLSLTVRAQKNEHRASFSSQVLQSHVTYNEVAAAARVWEATGIVYVSWRGGWLWNIQYSYAHPYTVFDKSDYCFDIEQKNTPTARGWWSFQFARVSFFRCSFVLLRKIFYSEVCANAHYIMCNKRDIEYSALLHTDRLSDSVFSVVTIRILYKAIINNTYSLLSSTRIRD